MQISYAFLERGEKVSFEQEKYSKFKNSNYACKKLLTMFFF